MFNDQAFEEAMKERLGSETYNRLTKETGSRAPITDVARPDIAGNSALQWISNPLGGIPDASAVPHSEHIQNAPPIVEVPQWMKDGIKEEQARQAAAGGGAGGVDGAASAGESSEQAQLPVIAAPAEQQAPAPPAPPPDYRTLQPLPPRPSETAPPVYRNDAVSEIEFLDKYKHIINAGPMADATEKKESIGKRAWVFLTSTTVGRFILLAMFLVVMFLVVMLLQGLSKLGTRQLFSVAVLIVIMNGVVVIFFLSRHF